MPESEGDTRLAASLMSGFAERTGLTSDRDPQRYLWTDAHALRNLLDLHRRTGALHHRRQAEALIAAVHGILGRHRPDDPRTGWLSGLPEDEGARHPTRGGLRIGKPLPERAPDDPADERLEWSRDGQYFHYLTRWMDALARAAAVLGKPGHAVLAAELGVGVLPRFLRRTRDGTPFGIAWKMSVDLSRPLVAGMNPQDALDGYVTFRVVQGSRPAGVGPGLDAEVAILRALCEGEAWATSDPLGLGGLLSDAARLLTLPDRTGFDATLAATALAGAEAGLGPYLASGALEAPARRRLAFRELGLAIGLRMFDAAAAASEGAGGRSAGGPAGAPARAAGTAARIVAFWTDPANREVPAWTEHRDINDVMLATALLDAAPRAD